MTTTIKLNDLEVEVIRKRIKNIYLKVCLPKGNIRISAPIQTSLWKIKKFAKSKLNWIKNKQKTINKNVKLISDKYINNERHYFLGDSYTLKIFENNKSSFVELCDKEILLNMPIESKVVERQSLMDKWYQEQLTSLIAPLIQKWERSLKVSVKKFYVRKMKTRWGSCTPRTRCIRFNQELAKTSHECLEYVVVHELVHLLEPSHNSRFKGIMDQFYPNWKLCRKELNKLQIRE